MEDYDQMGIITKNSPLDQEVRVCHGVLLGQLSVCRLPLLVGEAVWAGVSARCRAGPRTLSAAAMAQVLTAPLPATRLRAGAERYTLAASVADYTAALGLDGSSGAAP